MDGVIKAFEKEKKIPFHKIYERTGLRNVIGIGISGQYAIAGPIYVCGVLFKEPTKLKHTEKVNYEALAQEYRNNDNILWDLAIVPPGHVVHTSNKEAIRLGVLLILNKFLFVPVYDLIISEPFDWGLHTPESYRNVPTLTARHAPEVSDLVMVATVMAKSAREHFMYMLSRKFPEFGWDTNSGHGTPQHIEAIKKHGVCVEHRGLDQVKSLKGTTFKIYRGNDDSSVSNN